MVEVNSATLRHARISPKKCYHVCKQIRGMSVEKAADLLTFNQQKAAALILGVLRSAMANAENNNGIDVSDLYVSPVFADQGPTIKRFQPRARGRGDRILKRTSHITVKVATNPDQPNESK